jgi:hypothetical protein
MLTGGVTVLHDSAPLHVARIVQVTPWSMYWKVLDYLPYSPDFSQSDFHLFDPLKEKLKGRSFGSDEHVKASVVQWF